ncbi:MAG: SLC13/DASS family transporter [Xanthomonadales bacterium]|nr:SLC13/DASS family transporter [Xanthomonadales bacterium]MCB1633764.1 SLC13/DASS family transporter [Xanthomonadales bacterium]
MSFEQWKGWLLWLAPLAAALCTAVLAQQQPWPLAVTAGVTVWVALWWIFAPVPVAVTSLLPLALFPLFGVLGPREVAQAYGHEVILLLAGGFMLSAAIEAAGAHRRLAFGMLRLTGTGSARRVLWGFVLTSGLLSMWISNTATVLVLTPVAIAILGPERDGRLTVPLLLGIAYAASVGGMGTPIGTPPNLIFRSVYQEQTGEEIGFLSWFAFSLPILALVLPIIALWLGRNLRGSGVGELPRLGPWQPVEVRAVACFALVALAWVTRTEPFGGWRAWTGLSGASDASVALLGVVVMALLPDGKGGRVLEWPVAERIPWGTLVLFGGGLALAAAFGSSGLGEWLAQAMVGLSALPLPLTLLLLCLAVSFMTEITSNTATTALLMPILAAAAIAVNVDPALFMLPAALAASMAFMLPVATAPNAIAFGTGLIPAPRMLREGLLIDLLGVLAVSTVLYLVLR